MCTRSPRTRLALNRRALSAVWACAEMLSAPMSIDVRIPASYRIGDEASGFALMMETILPWFNIGNAAVSMGLAASATTAAINHVGNARLEHLGSSLADLPDDPGSNCSDGHRAGRAEGVSQPGRQQR